MKVQIWFTRFMLFLAVGSVGFLSGCWNKNCDDNPCRNGGVCNEGRCDCPAYYEGDNCGQLERDKFIGEYNITYRGYISDNFLTAPQQHRLDTLVMKKMETDAANNKIRLPDFLGYSGSTMTLTVVGNRLELTGADYPFRLNGQTIQLDIDMATGTLEGNQVIIPLRGAGLANVYQIDAEMILTLKP